MRIELKNYAFTYGSHSEQKKQVLKNFNLVIEEGSLLAVIGATGSGKSTLIQAISGLLPESEGSILYDGIEQKKFFAKNLNLIQNGKKISINPRSKIALCFQYPEEQICESTIEKEIAFGPKNYGFNKESCKEKVQEACALVILDYDAYKDRSPYSLSGGELRKVSIAGTIAIDPEVLILDEPTSGLDPETRKAVISMLLDWKKANPKRTLIVISHDLEEVVPCFDETLLLNNGNVVLRDKTYKVLQNKQALETCAFPVPELVRLKENLIEKGYELSDEIISEADLLNAILTHIKISDCFKDTL